MPWTFILYGQSLTLLREMIREIIRYYNINFCFKRYVAPQFNFKIKINITLNMTLAVQSRVE
jgi:hypothetical protein